MALGRRCGSDLALLWLWHRLVATAPIKPLAWEPPYATGAALKKTKDKKKITLNVNRLNSLIQRYMMGEAGNNDPPGYIAS